MSLRSVEISTDQFITVKEHIEETWGTVEKQLLILVLPGEEIPEHAHHTWDTVVYYPKKTYDGHEEGYEFMPANTIHSVPQNTTDKIRVSIYHQLGK